MSRKKTKNPLSSQVYSVSDPRLDIQQKLDIVLKGGETITWEQYEPNQVSSAGVTIQCDPPNRKIGVARCPLMTAVYNVVMAFTNTSSPAAPPLQNGYWGVRRNAYTATLTTHSMTINNDIATVAQVNQFDRALSHYYDNYNERFTAYSTTASMLDQFQNYSDGLNSNRNPLQPYGDNPYDQTRNDTNGSPPTGQKGGSIISNIEGNLNGSTSVSFTVTISEPLMFLSPLAQGTDGYYNNCLFGVDTMKYSATFSNLNRILSISNVLPTGVTITSVSTTLASASLLFQYIKPREDYILPNNIDYPYYNITPYTANGLSTAPNATVTIPSGTIKLDGVPRRIFVFCGLGDTIYNADPTSYNSSDTFMVLQSINLTYNTEKYLSTATQQDLYNMSVKNGCRMSWAQWSNYTGSVLGLDFAEDLGLNSNMAAGVNEKQQISIQATWLNTNQLLTINPPVMTVLVIYDGKFSIYDGFAKRNINTLSEEDVENAIRSPNITYKDMQMIYGGNIFGDIWNTIKKVGNFVKPLITPVLDTAEKVAGFTKYGAPARALRRGVRQLTGYGEGDDYGGAQTGGKGYMSKEDLMRNMEQY